MKKLFAVLALLTTCSTQPLAAQVSQAKYDSLVARVTQLEARQTLTDSIVGVKGFMSPPVPCDSMNARRPTWNFANGEYDLAYRNKQFGCFANGITDFQSNITPVINALITQVNNQQAIVADVAANAVKLSGGNLTIPGKLFIGDCDSGYTQILQLCGQKDAEIRFSSNRNGLNPQGAATHEYYFGGQSDGGIREVYNWNCKNGEVATQDNGACWRESNKPRVVQAFDSQGTWSLSRDIYPYIYPSQSLIIGFDDAARTILLQSMKAGWKIGTCDSPTSNNACSSIAIPPLSLNSTPTPFGDIVARSLTLANDSGNVVTLGLSRSNMTGNPSTRLHIGWAKNYSSEIETEPGPDLVGRGNIVGQFMQWGPLPGTPDGSNRKRLALSIVADSNGGLSGVLDATTNDKSGSPGQLTTMPLVLNDGEANGTYFTMFPDGRVSLRNGAAALNSTVAQFVGQFSIH